MTTTRYSNRKRTTIPASVRDEVLREAGYMCANPRCRHILTLELHHMVWVKDSGRNEPTNLIALCPNCHSLHTNNHIPASAIQHWKGILHALNHAFNKESTDLLLFLHAVPDEIWYSGDGLLKFAGLIAAGFVEITETISASGMSVKRSGILGTVSTPAIAPMTSHRVQMTEKGRAFVESWMKGDEESFKAIQST